MAGLVVEVDERDWTCACVLVYEFGNLAVDSGGVVVGKLIEVDMKDFEGECEDIIDDGGGIGGEGVEEGGKLEWVCEDFCGEDAGGGIRLWRSAAIF